MTSTEDPSRNWIINELDEIINYCYVCNHIVNVNDNMFQKRISPCGMEQKPLADVLGEMLDCKLEEQEVHSAYLCSVCKLNLTHYEVLENVLVEERLEIKQNLQKTLNSHLSTSKVQPDDEELIDVASCSASDLIEECKSSSDLVEECSTEQCESEQIDNFDDLIEVCTDSEYEESEEASFDLQPKSRRFRAEHSCTHCEKVFERKLWLEQHERTHTNERPFKCDHCEATFSQRANWRSHIMTVHDKVNNFKCVQCERTFNRRRLLNNHITAVHNNQRDYKCEHCPASFTSDIYYKKHLLCHTGEKNYRCDICGKDFSRAENRDTHLFVHSLRKPYACVVCNEGFVRRKLLEQHSANTKHLNPNIERLKPVFSAANKLKMMKQPPLLTGSKRLII